MLSQSFNLLTLFLGRLSPLSTCAHSFASNWQLPLLNQWKGENDLWNDFMINPHGSYMAELGFEVASCDPRICSQTHFRLCFGTWLQPTELWSQTGHSIWNLINSNFSEYTSEVVKKVFGDNSGIIFSYSSLKNICCGYSLSLRHF